MSAASPALVVSSSRIGSYVRDYAELTKLRVTTLIVATAWCGYFFAARQDGSSTLGWGLVHALLGIGLVSSGTAALNEVMERDVDKKMKRTASRPLPAGRMSLMHASAVGLLLTLGGSAYLWFLANPLTGILTFLTSVVYLAVYTPMKRVSPLCTMVGAFPGAMPGVLGWTAVRGQVSTGTLVLFAILFFWQFPHFFSIAWLYRDDYASGEIQMLPVVEPDGRSTAKQILVYSLLLIPVSLVPTLISMTGPVYLAAAVVLGFGLLYFSARLASCGLPATSPASKARARQLLRASVIYLPLLFGFMMAGSRHL
jgi:protoheme IX farnesyltransferase